MATEGPHTSDTKLARDAQLEDPSHPRQPLKVIENEADLQHKAADKVDSAEPQGLSAAANRCDEGAHSQRSSLTGAAAGRNMPFPANLNYGSQTPRRSLVQSVELQPPTQRKGTGGSGGQAQSNPKRKRSDEDGNDRQHRLGKSLETTANSTAGISRIGDLELDSVQPAKKRKRNRRKSKHNADIPTEQAEQGDQGAQEDPAEQEEQFEQEKPADREDHVEKAASQQTKSDAPSDASKTGRGPIASSKPHNRRDPDRKRRSTFWVHKGEKVPLEVLPKGKFAPGMIIVANLAESDFDQTHVSRQSRFWRRGSPIIFSKYRFWIIVVIEECKKAFLAVPMFTHGGRGLQNKTEEEIEELNSVRDMDKFPDKEDKEEDKAIFHQEGTLSPLRTNAVLDGFEIDQKTTVWLGYMYSFRFTEHLKWFGNLEIDSYNCLVRRLQRFHPKELKASDYQARYMKPNAVCDFGLSPAPQNDTRTSISVEDLDDTSVAQTEGSPLDHWLSGKGLDLEGVSPSVQEKLGSIFGEECDKTEFWRLMYDHSLKHLPGLLQDATEPVEEAPVTPSMRSSSKSES